MSAEIHAAGVVCFRDGEVLLVRRARPPRAGEWSLPGGRIEAGETPEAAALRELAEETGVAAELAGLVEVVRLVGEDGRGYVIHDFAARWIAGDPAPADDVDAAEFVSVATAFERAPRAELCGVIATARRMLGA